jgi:hypothetical protein
MTPASRHLLFSMLLITLLGTAGLTRPAQAGLADTVTALAGPLAEQFGVPASSVTSLLESGISLDTVTQMLLVSKSSDSELDTVSDAYKEAGNDIDDAAKKLEVAASDYSPERVTAAIDEAKAKAAEDAAKGANDAIGSALGGLNR